MRSARMACVLSFVLTGLGIADLARAQIPGVPDAPRPGGSWNADGSHRVPPRDKRADMRRPHPGEPGGSGMPVEGRPVGADFDEQRTFDGHMTPDERRLLRQHIEDAVRELYHH